MAAERPNQTVADYLTIVLSPALIMGLVGSLVLFLLEVLYPSGGPWRERLQWILFFFVFGAVLVARISMNGEIAGRASLYGSVLGFVTYLGLQSFIEYPQSVRAMSFLVNLFLVALVWWCAHRLTWDCTNVDEDTDMSGEGLLQASGLEEAARPQGEEEPLLLEEEKGAQSWWERYRKYREKKNRKRTLGVWVVYFSLAALPLFGLGQALIPVADSGRRRAAFWLMTIYVGCGLGLLLTTCFLGLRRYLRQKGLQMPMAMTGAWLTMGGILLGALLLVGALLPRPAAEYSPLRDLITGAGSTKRQASRYAVKGDSPAEGQGKPGEAGKQGKVTGERSGEKGQGQGKSDDADARGTGKDGQKQGDGKQGDGKQGDGKQGDGKQGDGKQGDGKQGDGKQGERGKSEPARANDGTRDGKQQQGSEPAREGDGKTGQTGGQSATSRSTGAIQQMMQRVAPVLKWLVFGVLALLVLGALLRGGLGFLANFTDWARRLLEAWRNFWANLFGPAGTEAVSGGEAEEDEEEEEEREEPFSRFANPFETGQADRLSSRALIRYTYRAVEAWARENRLGREDGETALEFLSRLADEVPALEREARELGQLHARAEYAPGGLPASTADRLRGVWEKLERVATSPLSA